MRASLAYYYTAFSKQQIVLEIIFIILSFSPLAEERKISSNACYNSEAHDAGVRANMLWNVL